MGEEEVRGEAGGVAQERSVEAVENRLTRFYFPGGGRSSWLIARG